MDKINDSSNILELFLERSLHKKKDISQIFGKPVDIFLYPAESQNLSAEMLDNGRLLLDIYR